MKALHLFPPSFKKVGALIFIPCSILAFLAVINGWEPDLFEARVFSVLSDDAFQGAKFFRIIENNIFDEILVLLAIIGGLFLAFAKEPDEDELIASIRLKSLVWATYVNYVILFLAYLLVYDVSFFWVMVANMFTILIFFIIRFNWMLWKLRKSGSHEE